MCKNCYLHLLPIVTSQKCNPCTIIFFYPALFCWGVPSEDDDILTAYVCTVTGFRLYIFHRSDSCETQMGTADAIVDLVNTGTTLKENNLK